MKKVFLLFLTMCFVMIGCTSSYESDETGTGTTVTFVPSLNETYAPITRASETPSISNIYVYEIVDDKATLLLHQTDLSPISLNLKYGTHELRFVATNSEDATLTGNILAWSRIKDTYVASTTVEVIAGLESQSVTLNRNVAKVSIAATDALPENTATAEITFKKHNSLDVNTLAVTELSNNSTSFTFNSTQYGATDIVLNVWTLTDIDENYTADITLKFLDLSGNTISYFTIPDVTIKHNTNTILTGAVFNRNTGMALDFNSTWNDNIAVTF